MTLRMALTDLLDTHREHDCGDAACSVSRARAALERNPLMPTTRAEPLREALAEGLHKAMCFAPTVLHNRLACERPAVYLNLADAALSHPAVTALIAADPAPAGAGGDVDALRARNHVRATASEDASGGYREVAGCRCDDCAALRATPPTPPGPLDLPPESYGHTLTCQLHRSLACWCNPAVLPPSSTPPEAATGLGEAEGLDVAWAEAEAALPKGWRMAAVKVAGDGWEARVWTPAEDVSGLGPTPAAALRALTARLHPRPTDSEPPE